MPEPLDTGGPLGEAVSDGRGTIQGCRWMFHHLARLEVSIASSGREIGSQGMSCESGVVRTHDSTLEARFWVSEEEDQTGKKI